MTRVITLTIAALALCGTLAGVAGAAGGWRAVISATDASYYNGIPSMADFNTTVHGAVALKLRTTSEQSVEAGDFMVKVEGDITCIDDDYNYRHTTFAYTARGGPGRAHFRSLPVLLRRANCHVGVLAIEPDGGLLRITLFKR
jgi:hypothetical protein